jgi:DNA polymerase
MPSKTDQLKKIRGEVWDLKESPLYQERIKNNVYAVIGEGNHDAKIMFVGEAPGKNEAEQGRPFCGAAGRVLDELLRSVEMPRSEVYVTNIVKDRPPMNRDPLPHEIAIYGPFLDRQIEIIQPKVIATLGRFSMQYIMEKFGLSSQLQSISKIHGKEFTAAASYGKVTVIPLFHPAVILYNQSAKTQMKEDFQILKKFSRRNMIEGLEKER